MIEIDAKLHHRVETRLREILRGRADVRGDDAIVVGWVTADMVCTAIHAQRTGAAGSALLQDLRERWRLHGINEQRLLEDPRDVHGERRRLIDIAWELFEGLVGAVPLTSPGV